MKRRTTLSLRTWIFKSKLNPVPGTDIRQHEKGDLVFLSKLHFINLHQPVTYLCNMAIASLVFN